MSQDAKSGKPDRRDAIFHGIPAGSSSQAQTPKK